MKGERALLYGAIGVVVAAVVTGLVLSGSPAKARLEKLDERRVQDLRSLVRAADLAWTRQGTLPGSLAELAELASLPAERTRDPQTGEPYEYRPSAGEGYELCATFALTADHPSTVLDRMAKDTFWSHGGGRHCFDLEARKLEP